MSNFLSQELASFITDKAEATVRNTNLLLIAALCEHKLW